MNRYMSSKKLLSILVGLVLMLQGCSSLESEAIKQEVEGEFMRAEMNEQLFQAVERGEADTVRNLIRDGVNLNAQDSEGRTGIMIATHNNDVETAKILLEAGADVNIQNDMKDNPFLYAGAEGYLAILKLTIDAGADPTITNRYGGTALIPAAEHGYVDVVEVLLTQTKIDVNHVNNLGWTALLEAILLNNGNKLQQETVQLLIDHGADVNIADHDNVTPLQHARKKGFKEIEAILLTAGAD